MDYGSLPKAELHLHIEGTLEPEMVFALAARNDVALPWASVEALRARYDFHNLQSFLDVYYDCMRVLRRREDFYDLAAAYLDRAHADGVCHAELSFDPQVHLAHGVALADIVGGLTDALAEARDRHGLTGGLILCFLRDLGPDAAAAVLRQAEPFAGDLLGVGLDSAEVGYPPEPFAAVFAEARAWGLHATAHAGEEGPPSYIWGALDALGAERIDHGSRALEDPALVARMAGDGIAVTSCPLSNVCLRVLDDLSQHPLREFLAAGIPVTVNSDDPAYFGGYVGANLTALAETLGLDDATVAGLCRASIEASFATAGRKAELLAMSE
jgi:adenosine deaminase